jgi:hypothetical protein
MQGSRGTDMGETLMRPCISRVIQEETFATADQIDRRSGGSPFAVLRLPVPEQPIETGANALSTA